MSRIAVIDAAIDRAYIGGKHVEFIDLCGGVEKPPGGGISHGTMCAMVLDHCADDYELVNIRIFDSDEGKVFCDVELLAKALNLCLELDIDVISLSAVSSILSDSRHLYGVTKKLSDRAAIVSALDNRRYVTVPTSYPHVFGVRSDHSGLLLPGEVAYHAGDPFSANLYANCGFPFLRDMGRGQSNSLAVPVVAAYVNGLFNEGYNISDIGEHMRGLREYPIRSIPNGSSEYEGRRGEEVPIVCLSGCGVDGCVMLMDAFFDVYEVQSAALSFAGGVYDIRVRGVHSIGCFTAELGFVKRHFKTDIIFVVADKGMLADIGHLADVDVFIEFDGRGVAALRYEGNTEHVHMSILADRLNELLS